MVTGPGRGGTLEIRMNTAMNTGHETGSSNWLLVLYVFLLPKSVSEVRHSEVRLSEVRLSLSETLVK